MKNKAILIVAGEPNSIFLEIFFKSLKKNLFHKEMFIIKQMSHIQRFIVDGHFGFCKKKSRIRETKHLSTDADSNTDTTVGWTKNTRKPKCFEKVKKSSKTQKLKNV